jgi:hypothetical protein
MNKLQQEIDEMLAILTSTKDEYLGDDYSEENTGLSTEESLALANRFIAPHKYKSGDRAQPSMLIRVPLKGGRENGTKTNLLTYRGNDSDLSLQAFIRKVRASRNEIFKESLWC